MILTPPCPVLSRSSPKPPAAGDPADRAVVRVHNLGKCFQLYHRPWDRLRQLWSRRPLAQPCWALRGVSLEIERGEMVGLVGANGSGKSTLLQLLAGTAAPTEGVIWLRGRVAALLELGGGFHPDFTGRENVFFQGSLLGFSPADLARRFDHIAAFAELGDHLDRPLRTYSTGMVVRLAFSLAVGVEPDILLVDEALAVGDLRFQHKCLARIRQLRAEGVTVILVTHDLETCRRFCQRVFVLEHGRLVRGGPAAATLDWYFARMMSPDAPPRADRRAALSMTSLGTTRHGDGQVRIAAVRLRDSRGQLAEMLTQDDVATLEVDLVARHAVPGVLVGFYLRDRLGTEICGATSRTGGHPPLALQAGEHAQVSFRFRLPFRPGSYALTVAVSHDDTTPRCCDWIDNVHVFELVSASPDRVTHGLIDLPVTVHIDAQPPTNPQEDAPDAHVAAATGH